MNPRVTSVVALERHALLLTFTNGEQRRMDVRPCLVYPVFERLREPAFFALVQADYDTVSWPGGIDLDPDSVYLESVPSSQAAPAKSRSTEDPDSTALGYRKTEPNI